MILAYADALQTGKELELANMEGAVREAAAAAWEGMKVDPTTLAEERETARMARKPSAPGVSALRGSKRRSPC